MSRTYEGGQLDNLSLNSADLSFGTMNRKRICNKHHTGSDNESDIINVSTRSLSGDSIPRVLVQKKKYNKTSQTMLSFPSPYGNSNIYRNAYNLGIKFLPRNLSVDDVMKLVDTEEGDILVLTELIRDDSNISDNSDDGNQFVNPRLFSNYHKISSLLPNSPSTSLIQNTFTNHVNPYGMSTTLSMHDIERTEEMEDRILFGRATNMFSSPTVHFRHRLSLIPSGNDVIDEGDEEGYMDEDEENENDDDDDDDTRPLETILAEEPQTPTERIRFPINL
uniref:Bestrophin homolog n=1 Tax=Elaeophora elaphi TaxID=1147741 RepID=A0A0R3RUE1_9BILA